MELEVPRPDDEGAPEDEATMPISIRKLDRLETTLASNSQGT